MPIYHNKHHEKHASLQSGPYTFKHGLIRVDEASDSTVGPILKNFYGCELISEADATKILSAVKAAKTTDAAKKAAEAAEAAKKAIEEAEAAEAAKKAAEKSGKPEDKM